MSAAELIALLREWDFHNRPRHRCYYEQSDESYAPCPSEYNTLRAFLVSSGFPMEKSAERIFGRDLNEPNFWSEKTVDEIPVEGMKQRSVTSDASWLIDLDVKGVHPRQVTIKNAEEGPQEATAAPVENEHPQQTCSTHRLIMERLDEINNGVNQVLRDVDELRMRVERIEDALGVRSAPVEDDSPNNLIDNTLPSLKEVKEEKKWISYQKYMDDNPDIDW